MASLAALLAASFSAFLAAASAFFLAAASALMRSASAAAALSAACFSRHAALAPQKLVYIITLVDVALAQLSLAPPRSHRNASAHALGIACSLCCRSLCSRSHSFFAWGVAKARAVTCALDPRPRTRPRAPRASELRHGAYCETYTHTGGVGGRHLAEDGLDGLGDRLELLALVC